jgi:uncharacterized protein
MSPLQVNLRHLAKQELSLQGTLPAEGLDLDGLDRMIRVSGPLAYDLQVQKMEQSLLVQGHLAIDLACDCVRCLKAFTFPIVLQQFVAEIPLEGEEAAVEGDFVDLTPYLREDIILAFPQHPLCEPGCAGLPSGPAGTGNARPGPAAQLSSPVWAALNELKL